MKGARIVIYTLMYYTVSLTHSFFSSYFLNEREYNFKFALFTTGCQNVIHFLLASIYTSIRKENTNKLFNTRSLPCAIMTAIDIGTSSYALRHVTLAFYTMIKSSAPVFILLCGFLFKVEEPSAVSFLLMFMIGSGVFLTTWVDTSFDLWGFTLIGTASFMSGFRWAYIQYLIKAYKYHNITVISTIRELSLPMSIVLLLFSSYVEGIPRVIKSEFSMNYGRMFYNGLFISFGGFLSFCLLISEFKLVEVTSVVYLSMSGLVKELFIIFYSVAVREVTLGVTNVIGLFISTIGIFLFNLTRTHKQDNATGAPDGMPVIVVMDKIDTSH